MSVVVQIKPAAMPDTLDVTVRGINVRVSTASMERLNRALHLLAEVPRRMTRAKGAP